MPFGPYKDFADCVTKQKADGKSDIASRRICGLLQDRLEGGSSNKIAAALTQEDFNAIIATVSAQEEEEIQKAKKLDEIKDAAFENLECEEMYATIRDGDVKVGWNSDQHRLLHVRDLPHSHVCVTKDGKKHIERSNTAAAAASLKTAADDENLTDAEIIQKVQSMSSISQCAAFMQEYGMHDSLGEARAHCEQIFQDRTASTVKETTTTTVATTEKLENPAQSLKIGAIVDKFNQGDKLFIKSFLIDASVNLNDWGVTEESLAQRINTFIGKPLVLMENFDHPNLSDKSLSHAMEYQEDFRIGNIVDITQRDRTYYAIIEITDAKAKAAFQNSDLPLYVSPAIAKLQLDEPENAINNWIGVHVAIVDKPAYTVRKAMITGQCAGKEQECLLQLRNARIKQHGYGNCGFCITAALMSKAITPQQKQQSDIDKVKAMLAEDLKPKVKVEEQLKEEEEEEKEKEKEKEKDQKEVSSLDTKTDQKTLETNLVDNQSQQQSQQQPQPNTTAVSNVENSPPSVAAPQVQQQQPQTLTPQQIEASRTTAARIAAQNVTVNDPTGQAEAEFTKLTARIEHLEGALKTANQTINQLTTDNHKIVQAYRRSEFEKIISANIYADPERRKGRIEELLATSLTPEQVYEIYRDVTSAAPVSTQPIVQTAAYEPRMPYLAAASTNSNNNNVNNNSSPANTGAGNVVKQAHRDDSNDLAWLEYSRSLVREGGA